MTHPLTEKIFNAVYTWLETIHKSGMTFDQSNSLLRTAIASVLDGEVSINLNEVEKLVHELAHQYAKKEVGRYGKVYEQLLVNWRTRIGYDLSQLKEGGV